MKIKDLEAWPPIWSTSFGSLCSDPLVPEGTLKAVRLIEQSQFITLVVLQEGVTYYGTINIGRETLELVGTFLRKNVGRPLAEVVEEEV